METLGPVYSRVSFYVEYSSYHADAAELRVLSILRRTTWFVASVNLALSFGVARATLYTGRCQSSPLTRGLFSCQRMSEVEKNANIARVRS